MRKPIGLYCICAVAVVALAGTVGADQRAVDVLKAETPLVRFYEEGSRITRVYGQPLAFGFAPEESAEQFLFSHAEVFDVAPGDLVPAAFPGGVDFVQPMMFEQETGDYKFFLVRYVQQMDGIPVFRADARLLVRNAADFPLVLVASALRDLGDFIPDRAALQSAFDPAQAVVFDAETFATATGFDGTTDYTMLPADQKFDSFSAPQAVIWAGVEEEIVKPRLAYTFIGEKGTPQDDDYAKWLFVVDVLSGEILYKKNLIIFEDVVGNVSGMATTIPKSAPCNPEVLTPMAYARVYIQDGESTYADENGDFVIPNAGSEEVTVFSPMSGHRFYVDNVAGSEETLSEDVIPPGPVNFTHNEANSNELIRAQVNGYVQANVVRDFALIYNPDYPVIAYQTNFPVNVNRTDIYCPGNAWYDGSSINFCRAGGSYPNTAYSSVVHHEYGHHLVSSGGSGQDAYGEGMADCAAMLIADDPVLGYGFTGNCNAGIRNADNNIQYPCSGEIHYCGQLLSGCVWSTRQELEITYPGEALDIISNLTINSILLHSGGSITPSITIDFLTVDDDDGDIYNGTPHAVEICAGFGAHNMDCPDINFDPIGFAYPDGRPETVYPGQQTVFAVHVVGLSGTPVPGTGEFHYSLDEGSWQTVAMPETAPNEYEAVLPAIGCGSSYEWYVSAEASGEGTFTDPRNAPTQTYFAPAATGIVVLLDDEFETDQGWTVYPGADTGDWERADPQQVNYYGTITQPGDDHTPDGTLCYVTGPLAGSSAGAYDVDGGPTHLTSPVFDLSAGGGTVSYWRWYHISTVWDDALVVQVSNDNGANWVLVESVIDRETWTYVEWNVGDYVTPTDQVRVRFTADDSPNNSLVEALIDDFMLTALVCEEPECPGDLDGDNDIDLTDLSILLTHYGMTSGAEYEDGDLDGDGDVDLTDLSALLAVYGTSC